MVDGKIMTEIFFEGMSKMEVLEANFVEN